LITLPTGMSMATDTRPLISTQDSIFIGRIALAVLATFWANAAKCETWQVTPLIGVAETYSDNMALVTALPERGWISEIAPGIAIDGQSARLRAYLDYRRQNIYYQGNSEANRRQNQLDAFAKLEVLDNWLFVDASSRISQNSLSTFGPVSADGTSANANQVETRSTLASPYIRGQLSDIGDYVLRYSVADLRSDSASLPGSRVNQYLGSVKSRTTGAIGWFGDGIGTSVKNDLIGDRDDTRFRAGIIIPAGAHLHISAFGGRESTNFATKERVTNSTTGAGFEWSPGKHTQFAGLRERRFFGYGHSLQLTHRTALTAWRYSDNRDVATFPALLGGYTPGTIQELMSDLLEASIPDPVERGRAVRTRMDLAGSTASLSGVDGVLTSRLFLDRVREASVALLGVRNTLTFLMRQRDEALLAGAPVANDSFSESADIRERSASLAWLYRLAPLTTLNASLVYRKARALDIDGPQATQNTLTIALGFRLAPKADASLAVRRLRSDGSAIGLVRENALIGSFTQRF
jgi:uncharacterized protein (PEP-CTERM system associated)